VVLGPPIASRCDGGRASERAAAGSIAVRCQQPTQ